MHLWRHVMDTQSLQLAHCAHSLNGLSKYNLHVSNHCCSRTDLDMNVTYGLLWYYCLWLLNSSKHGFYCQQVQPVSYRQQMTQ